MNQTGHVAHRGGGGGRRGANRGLAEKSERKRSLGRPRCKWEDNIKMGLQVIGWGSMDWIDMAQDSDQWRALVKIVMDRRVP
jgi:hypothetical protein